MPRPSPETNGSGNATSVLVDSTNHEKFIGRWKKFEAGTKEMLAFSKYIGSVEELLDRNSALERKLEAKSTEIKAFEEGRGKMLEGFAEKYTSWKDAETELREDLRNAKSKIQKLEASTAASQASSISIELCNRKVQEEREKTDQRVASAAMERAAELQGLQKKLTDTAKKLKAAQTELSEKSTFLLGAQQQLRSCQRELEERRNEIGLEDLDAHLLLVFCPLNDRIDSVDIKASASDLMDLSMRFHELTRSYFFSTLPKDLSVVGLPFPFPLNLSG
jgi:DNA repair exonuclease SbcCD ATPase subunit